MKSTKTFIEMLREKFWRGYAPRTLSAGQIWVSDEGKRTTILKISKSNRVTYLLSIRGMQNVVSTQIESYQYAFCHKQAGTIPEKLVNLMTGSVAK